MDTISKPLKYPLRTKNQRRNQKRIFCSRSFQTEQHILLLRFCNQNTTSSRTVLTGNNQLLFWEGSVIQFMLTWMIKLNFSATMFGNGVYFARDASYSTQAKYSPPDGNGNRYMYLARVLVGEYAAGRQGMITPPAKGSDATDAYDSVVDGPGNPKIFVVFYDSQCYPDYLVTFKWARTLLVRIPRNLCNELIFSILFRSNVEWRRRKIPIWESTFYEVCQKKVLVFWVVMGKLAQVGF